MPTERGVGLAQRGLPLLCEPRQQRLDFLKELDLVVMHPHVKFHERERQRKQHVELLAQVLLLGQRR